MRMLILIFISLTFLGFSDNYAVEKQDGSIVIASYSPSSQDSFAEFLNSVGLSDYKSITKVEKRDLPENKDDRKYWKKNPIPIGKKVVIDAVKKQADEAEESAKEQKKKDVILKLKISEQEFDDLFYVEAPTTGKKTK